MDDIRHIPLIDAARGTTIESAHYGSAAVFVNRQKYIFNIGDAVRPFFLRSSAKLFQVLAFFKQSGIKEYQLTHQEIAIICSPHSRTDEYVKILVGLQKKVGIQEDMLQCGVHPPLHRETALRMLKNNEPLHSNRHNCSGKHTHMLAFVKMIGAPMNTYLELFHPVQQHTQNYANQTH